MRRFLMLFATVCASTAVASVPRATAGTGYYSSTDIASLGRATAINDAGVVVGTSGDTGTSGASFAFVWSSAAGLQRLTGSADSPAGATAVSSTGMVVGQYGMNAFAWTPDAGLVDLGRGIARAVNASGVIVGDDWMHPTVWMPSGETIDLFAGSTDSGMATDVNAGGRVVGLGHADYSSSYVFTWTREGGLTRIVDAAQYGVPTVKVNDAGIVAGTYTVPPYNSYHGFVWTEAGGLVDLGEFVPFGGSAVADVNGDGAVVGYGLAGPTVPPAQHAFLWTPQRGLTDLGTLGGKRSYATAIAENGTVVGYSQTAGSAIYHAFVWTATTGMLDLGFAGEESQSLAVNASGWVVGYTGPSNAGWLTGKAILWQPRDLVPPTLILPPDLTLDATSAAGAVVSYTVSARDDVDPSPVIVCAPTSGATFPIGDTTVRCTARDETGNTASGSFAVHVRGPAEQIERLAVAVRALQLPYGIENSLLVKLDTGELEAFEHAVDAQTDKSIALTDAADLIARARQIEATLR